MKVKHALTFGALSCLSILLLAACSTGIPETPTVPVAPSATPVAQADTPTPRPPRATPTSDTESDINITRQDLDDAMAKWSAADAREYEVIASFGSPYSDLSGDWRLRVRDGVIAEIWRGDVSVFLDDSGNSIPNPEANPGTLGFLTVDSQFRDIMELFDDPSSMDLEIGGERFGVQYDIKLNDELGYPEEFYSNPIRITDNSQSRQIKQIRILEQGPNAKVVVTPAPPFTTPTAKPTSTSIPVEPTGTATPVVSGQEVIIEAGNPQSFTDYTEALTKWSVNGPAKYEITARVMGEGTEQSWNLRVENGKVTVLGSSEGTDVTEADYEMVLPDKQFLMIAQVLAGDDDIGMEVNGQQFHITYAVTFDPDQGYPTRFEMRVMPGPVMDIGYVVIVDDFKEIK
jgi:hypothetical protein